MYFIWATGGLYSSMITMFTFEYLRFYDKENGHQQDSSWYEGCSNMNASSFITFVTYMLPQNGICFYKGLYVTFKLAPDLKKNTVYLLSYIPLNEGHLSILSISMLRTYTSDIKERMIL